MLHPESQGLADAANMALSRGIQDAFCNDLTAVFSDLILSMWYVSQSVGLPWELIGNAESQALP